MTMAILEWTQQQIIVIVTSAFEPFSPPKHSHTHWYWPPLFLNICRLLLRCNSSCFFFIFSSSVELHNSQVVLKGCETPGYVIVSAARARIMSHTHVPIWKQGQLRSKSTWTGDIDCMQVRISKYMYQNMYKTV